MSHMQTKAGVILVAILSATSCLPAETALQAGPAAALTGFSWDHVPLYIHFGKRNGDLTDAEIDFLATHSRLIALEKWHGAGVHGSTEAGVADTARRLKQRNPAVKVLFYLNPFINWPGYESFKTYRSEWTLRTAAGEIVTHSSGTPPPTRRTWSFANGGRRGGDRAKARTD